MKTKIVFKIGILEILFLLIEVFFAGILINSTINDKFIYAGLLLVSAGILLLRKRVKIAVKDK